MEKWQNQRAWFLVMPVVLLVAFNALIPLMTVVNYSVQDIFDSTHRLFVGTEWYRETLLQRRGFRMRCCASWCSRGWCC